MARLPDVRALGGRPTPRPAGMPSLPAVNAAAPARAIGQGFGAMTQAVAQVGAAKQKIDNRDAFVARSKSTTAYNEQAVAELRRLQTETDLSDQETVSQYRQFLQNSRDQIISSHGFSADSAATLEGQLEGIYGRYMGEATRLSLDAKRAAADDEMGRAVNQIVASVYGNPAPENLLEQFGAAGELLQNAEMGYTPNEIRDWRQQIESQLVEATVTSFLDRGDVRAAEQALSLTGVSDILTPEKRQQIFSRIGTARAAAASRLAQKQKPIEVDGRLVDWEGNVIYDGSDEGVTGRFGTGLRAGTLDVFLSFGSEYAAGTTTPEEDQLVETAVTEYTQPYRDQNTGLWVQPELPDYMQRALEARGQGSLPEEVAAAPAQRPKKPTVYDMALTGDLTGPLPAGERALGRMPLVGRGGGKASELQKEVEGMSRQLVRVLQNNPRFAEGERKAIAAEINIEPKVWDNQADFIDRLMGIASSLERRIQFMQKLVASPNTPQDQRYWAHAGIIAIEDFLQQIMPPRMHNQEQAEAFISNNPSGTPVMLLNKETGKWEKWKVP